MPRRKIAKALVETSEIRSVFGDASQSKFNIPDKFTGHHCPLCKTENIHSNIE